MSDVLRDLLVREADARIAGEVVPSVADIHARTALPAARFRRRRPAWLAPLVAAACVVALVLGVAQLTSFRHREAAVTAVIPPAPKLSAVVPPLVVRQRLGAPAGHLNGPPVTSAQTLAVSPVKKNGLGLRTVEVVTPHAPDGQGNPKLNRCTYTYAEPGAPYFNGRCEWSAPAVMPEPEESLTVEMKGGPGKTWVQGTAPSGTAAVVLRSPGRKLVVVAVADSGAAWNHRPFYVAWRDRISTDLFALDRHQHVLGRAHLPGDRVSHRPGDPELGTVETPLGLWEMHAPRNCTFPRPGDPSPTASTCTRTSAKAPARVDVLARHAVSDTVTVFRYGLISGDYRCDIEMVRDYGPDAESLGGGGGCGSAPPGVRPPLQVGRSFSAGTGKPEEQLLSGEAVRGTVRIRLSAPGVKTVEIPAYDGGQRWQHRAYFIAPWPSAPHTRVQALGRDGQVLASTISRGLNPKAFDTDFLEAVATCMEQHGITVTRTPQGHGMAPMYSFERGSLTNDQMRTTQEACEDEADRTTS